MNKRQLQALCKKFKIQHPDKEIDDEKITKKELVRLVRMYSNEIKDYLFVGCNRRRWN